MKKHSNIKTLKLKFHQNIAGLKNSSFVRNVFVVMSGTAAAQAIGLALTPIISRLFSPSDFGVFGSFIAVLSVISAGVTLDYAQALMLPKRKEDAFIIFVISCASTAMISVCCLAVCLFAPNIFQGLMKTHNSWMTTLLVVGILVAGINQSCQAWCVRCKAFKLTSASQVIRSLSSNGMQVILGYFKGGSVSLIFSTILADIVASVKLIRVVLSDLKAFSRNIRWDRMKQLAMDYRDFPIYSASMNVINALSQGLPVILLAHFYGIAVAGAYSFGIRIMSRPMGFVLRALRQVLFQKASETYNHGGVLLPLYIKTTLGLFALALFPTLIVFIWAPQIFELIFGHQWQLAGEFAQSLVLWLMFMFCNLPSILISRIIRIQRMLFFFDLALFASRALVLIVGGLYMPPTLTIILFSMIGVIMNIILIIIVGCALISKKEVTRVDPSGCTKGDGTIFVAGQNLIIKWF